MTKSMSRLSGKEELTVDFILGEHVQPVGLWQFMITLQVALSFAASSTLTIFILGGTKFRCKQSPSIELLLHNFTFEESCAASGPINGCYRYVEFNDSTSGEIRCSNGHVHQVLDIYYPGSVVPEWDLVCENEWKIPFVTTVYMFGMLFGYILGGQASGVIGRRRSIIWISLMQFFSINCSSFCQSYVCFLSLRLIVGLATGGLVTCSVVLISEITNTKHRTLWTTVLFSTSACVNRIIVTMHAYFFADWRIFNVVSTSFTAVCFLYPFLLPESPKWLISTGRKKEAMYQLYNGYLVNHFFKCFNRQNIADREKSMAFFSESKSFSEKDRGISRFMRKPYMDVNPQRGAGIIELNRRTSFIVSMKKTVGTRDIAAMTLKCIIIFSCQSSLTFGLMFYVRVLKRSIYFTTFSIGLASIPSSVLSYVTFKYSKSRRCPIIIIALLTACTLIASGLFVLLSDPVLEIVLIVGTSLCLVFVNCNQILLTIYGTELFPADMRAQAIGNASGLSVLSASLCDFINQSDVNLFHGLPMFIYAGFMLVQVIVILRTEETMSVANTPTSNR